MSSLALVLLAVGLAMDATAVAGARGLAAGSAIAVASDPPQSRGKRPVHISDALRVALFFGGAQAIMPAIGWALGAALATRIAAWGAWLTFGVLGLLGVKMIVDALKKAGAPGSSVVPSIEYASVFNLKVLAALAIATSIDALAAGVTLAFAPDVGIFRACAVIGVITAVLSFVGVYVGRRFGERFGKRLDLIGGAVLIGLAVKTLIDHSVR